jgi:hypothetical protein
VNNINDQTDATITISLIFESAQHVSGNHLPIFRSVRLWLQHKQHIKHLSKKPTPPILNAQLKLHKSGAPIRPVINNKIVLSYNMAKKLNNIHKKHSLLDNHYTTHNSTNLANDLVKLTINDKNVLITLDIKDLYVNIPIKQTIDITRTQLLKHNDRQTTNQISTLLEVILRQNY